MRRPHRPFVHVGTTAAIVIGSVALILLIARLLLPVAVGRYVNRKLNEIHGYEGHIDGVSIHLWRGAYSIRRPRLDKVGGGVPVPFFSARKIDLALDWGRLFHGAAVGRIDFYEPRINIVEGPTEATRQEGADPQSVADRVRDLFPLRIDRLTIRDGELHFRAFHGEPKVDVYLQRIDAVAHNLTNSKKVSRSLMASLVADGRAMHSGRFKVWAKIDPVARHPTFDLAVELVDLHLPELNSLFEHYLDVQVKDGTFGLFTECAAKEGEFRGYVKPIVKNLDVVKLKPEKKSVGEAIKGFFVKIGAWIFKNRSKQQLATRVELSGRFDQPKPDVWKAIVSFLENAFIRALPAQLEPEHEAAKVGLPETGTLHGPKTPKQVDVQRSAEDELHAIDRETERAHEHRSRR